MIKPMALRMHDVIEPFMRLKYEMWFYDKYTISSLEADRIKAVGQKKNTEHKIMGNRKGGKAT
jgi:hypothetical protein